MIGFVCEMCGSNDLFKQESFFVCQKCGMKYAAEEIKKIMGDNAINTGGTIKIDSSDLVEKYSANGRRAYENNDWEEVEKYYNMVEQNAPNNKEAIFFSAFGKAMVSLTDNNYSKRDNIFAVFIKYMSIIPEWYEDEGMELLRKIEDAIIKMLSANYVYNPNAGNSKKISSYAWQRNLFNAVIDAFIKELRCIAEKNGDPEIQEMIVRLESKKLKNVNSFLAGALAFVFVFAIMAAVVGAIYFILF